MSVLLFSRENDFQNLANAYETMKPLLRSVGSGTEEKFYKALRRLYFANVATYLCQYHHDTGLPEKELKAIDPFASLEGKPNVYATPMECAYTFVRVWSHLKYNLVTNDGEEYLAKKSYEFMDDLALHMCRVALKRFAPGE